LDFFYSLKRPWRGAPAQRQQNRTTLIGASIARRSGAARMQYLVTSPTAYSESLNDVIRAHEHRLRNRQPERLAVLRLMTIRTWWLLHWKVGRLGALQIMST